MASPLIGCRMNLITQAEVRYEGVLEHIDEEGDTVTLSGVQCFGTEKRRLDQILPASDKIHEYLTFRRSQIKELSKCDIPELFDPAIVQSGPPPSKSPHLRAKAGEARLTTKPNAAPQNFPPAGPLPMRTTSSVEPSMQQSSIQMPLTSAAATTDTNGQPLPTSSINNSESSFNNLHISDGGSNIVLSPVEHDAHPPPPLMNGMQHNFQQPQMNGGFRGMSQPAAAPPHPQTRGSSPSIPSTASFDQSSHGGPNGNLGLSDDNFPPMGRSVSRGPVAAVGATGGASPPGDIDQDIYVDVNMPQANVSSRPVSQGSALTHHSQHSRPGMQPVEHDDGIYNQIASPSNGNLELAASGMGQGDGYYELDSTRSVSRMTTFQNQNSLNSNNPRNSQHMQQQQQQYQERVQPDRQQNYVYCQHQQQQIHGSHQFQRKHPVQTQNVEVRNPPACLSLDRPPQHELVDQKAGVNNMMNVNNNNNQIPPSKSYTYYQQQPITPSGSVGSSSGEFGERGERSPSPAYVLYNPQRASTVSERVVNHSDTLNRMRYTQAPGGPTGQGRQRPLEEYYREDSSEGEDEMYESEKPRPGVETMIPQDGEQVSVSHDPDVPDTLEGALHYFGTKCSRLNCISQIDKGGKIYKTLNYGSLFSKAEQIAVHLTQTTRRYPNPLLKPGDRVALVFPNWEPGQFMCAFYGCQMAGVIPVPCDVPVSKTDVGSDDVGFMLQNCNITVALTTSTCMKNFPKDIDGEIAHFKNWPRLTWVGTDKIKTSVPRGWSSSGGGARAQAKEIREAYIELTTDSQGVNKGVLVCKPAVDAHCEKLRYCCNYQRGETMVCIPDFRRDVGLWHGVLASVFNGMHVIFVPYSLMKQDPMQWLYVVQRNKAASAIVKSRDLHWATAQVSQMSSSQSQIDLRCLKLLLMTDGSNPWAVSICDSFSNLFKARCGFRPEVLCPCATSTEAMTVSIRRPNSEQPGRGCLNIRALSYGVVKIESSTDDGATVLTLQDSGFIMPTSSIAVIKPRVAHNWKGKETYRPYLCKIDEVGEICLASQATAQGYWNFNGFTNNTFKVEPLGDDGRPIRNEYYVRTGLLGFLGPSNLVFIVGKTDNVLFVDGRMHNSDDIVATILGVDPPNFVFRGRVVAFTIELKRRNKIVVVCEQRNYPAGENDDTESQAWMQNVVQLIPRIHGIDIYCLALLPRNGIPKTDLSGLNLNETKKRFMQGRLNPCNVLMQPMACVRNLKPPRPEFTLPALDSGEPFSMLVGGDPMGIPAHGLQGTGEMSDDNPSMQYVHEVLKWRGADEQNNSRLFTLMNSKAVPICQMDAITLRKRSERLAMLVKARCPNAGSHVAVLYPAGLELVIGLYAVLYAGCIPVLLRAPPSLHISTGSGGTAEHAEKFMSTVKVLVAASKVVAIVTSSLLVRSLKNSKEIRGAKPLPPLINADETMRGRVQLDNYLPKDGPGSTCYLDLSVSAQGVLQGVEISHAQLAACCRSMKRALELYPSRKLVLCLEPFSGMSLILWCFLSVFTGHETVLISPQEMEMNPAVWFSTLSHHSARDTFVSSSVIHTCVTQLNKQVELLKTRGINLNSLRNCVVVTEERPRAAFISQFLLLFKPLGLNDKVLSSAFGCRVNPAVCFHCNGLSTDTSAVFVSKEALRFDKIEVVAKGAPGSLKLIESATILPGVKIVIANPYTLQQCPDLRLGEIWVSSQHNVAKFFTDTPVGSPGTQLNARLDTGDAARDSLTFARTGYLGFIRRTEFTHADGERHDALYVVGSMAEKIPVRQGVYYPSDIEDTVKRCCPNLVSESAVFSYSDMLVVVAEISAHETEALNAIPLIVNAVIEEHNLIVGVVVLTDPCVIPFNPRGEKQRMTLRDSFISDEFMPIYVAYNL